MDRTVKNIFFLNLYFIKKNVLLQIIWATINIIIHGNPIQGQANSQKYLGFIPSLTLEDTVLVTKKTIRLLPNFLGLTLPFGEIFYLKSR